VLQTGFVLLLVVAVIALIASLAAAVRLVIRPSIAYWASGFPVLLATCIGAYGFFKADLSPLALVVGTVAALAGRVIARRMEANHVRYLPIAVLILFLLVAEVVSLPRALRSSIMMVGAGLIAAATWHWRKASA
jgi:hypothetical protein